MTRESMGEPVTQAQFFERMQQFDDRLQDYHRRQRQHIDDSVRELKAVLATHEDKDNAVERRVTIIETQRESEKEQAKKAGAYYGVLAAAGVNALILAVKRLVGWQD